MCREGNRVGSRSKLSGSLVEALQDNIVFTVAFNHCLETTENKPHKHICDIRILTELHRSFTRKKHTALRLVLFFDERGPVQ